MKTISNKLTKIMCAACAAVLAAGTALTADAEWQQFRGDPSNNGVVEAALPESGDKAALYWATKIGTSMWGEDGPSPLTINGDTLYFSAENKIYKMDKETGETIGTGDMAGAPAYGLIPPLYADGMVFVGLNNGTVQAFDADTLESLWVYKDALGGQTNVALTYNDGCLYTGFWKSETADADFVCIDVTDEDTTRGDEEKTAEWTYTSKGGFYLTGAYVNEEFAFIGTDDGEEGSSSETAKVITFDKKTGEMIDSIDNIKGDIRTCMVYSEEDGRYYFATKGGLFCSVQISDDGKISDLQTIDLGASITSTPVVNNGRAYVGIAGTGWDAYNGAKIAVIDLETSSVAYTAETAGTPQTGGLLWNDGEYNYVYFIENASPSTIRVIKDKKGVTEVIDPSEESGHICAPALFTPTGDQAQYGMYNPICDDDGTIYFKNDSSYIMAVGSTVESLKVETPVVCKEGEKPEFTVTAVYANGTEKDVSDRVSYSVDELTTDDDSVTVTFDYALYNNGENGAGTEVKPFTADADVTVLGAEDYEKVMAFISAAANIPEEITKDAEDAVKAAEDAYAALDEDLRAYVEDEYNVVAEARKKLDNLDSSSSESSSSNSESSSESSEPSSSDTSSDSSTSSAKDSSSAADSKTSSSSKAASQGTTANPSTGAAAGGLIFAASALLGCVVVRKKK